VRMRSRHADPRGRVPSPLKLPLNSRSMAAVSAAVLRPQRATRVARSRTIGPRVGAFRDLWAWLIFTRLSSVYEAGYACHRPPVRGGPAQAPCIATLFLVSGSPPLPRSRDAADARESDLTDPRAKLVVM
jgi:hypothetical protein